MNISIKKLATAFAGIAFAFGLAVNALGATEVGTWAGLLSAASSGGEIVLTGDIEVTEVYYAWEGLYIENSVELDLAGHTISVPAEAELSDPLFYVAEGGTLTIKGNGTIDASSYEGSDFAVVNNNFGGPLTIKSGVTIKANLDDSLYAYALDCEEGDTTIVEDGVVLDGAVSPAGFTFASDGKTVAGKHTVSGGNVVVESAASDPSAASNPVVAKIGDTEYTSLAAAVSDVPANGTETTIVLQADTVLDAMVTIAAGKNVKLDLNGRSITTATQSNGNHYYAFDNCGTLVVMDSATGGNITSRGVYNHGVMTLNGGTIDACDGNGGYAINMVEGSGTTSFAMNGGLVIASNEDDHGGSSGGYDPTAMKVGANCTAVLNGGAVSNVCDFTYAIEVSGTLRVANTALVDGAHGAIAPKSGASVMVEGGQLVCSGVSGQSEHTIYLSGNSSLSISGGSLIHSAVSADGLVVCVSGSTAGSSVTISGGTFTQLGNDSCISKTVWGGAATFAVSGGTFNKDFPDDYLVEGATKTDNGNGTWTVTPPAFTYNDFVEALYANNGSFDGSVAAYSDFSKDESGRLIVRVEPVGGDWSAANCTATWSTPYRLNDGAAQLQLFHSMVDARKGKTTTGVTDVAVSNVAFIVEAPASGEVTGGYNNYNLSSAKAYQLYLMNDGDVTFDNCEFDGLGIAVFPPEAYAAGNVAGGYTQRDNTTIIKDCSIKNIYDYAIKEVNTPNYYVTGTTFENCGIAMLVYPLTGGDSGTAAFVGNTFKNIDNGSPWNEKAAGGSGTVKFDIRNTGTSLIWGNNTVTNCSGTADTTYFFRNVSGNVVTELKTDSSDTHTISYLSTGVAFATVSPGIVTVSDDGTVTWEQPPVAQVGTAKYATLQAAVNAVCNETYAEATNITVVLLTNVTELVTVAQKENLNLTIQGVSAEAYPILYGTIQINGGSRASAVDTLTIKNIDFEYDSNSSASYSGSSFVRFLGTNADTAPRYGHNVTIEDCAFHMAENADYLKYYAVVAPAGSDPYAIKLDGVVANNIRGFFEGTSVSGLSALNCTGTNLVNGFWFTQNLHNYINGSHVVISNSTVEADNESEALHFGYQCDAIVDLYENTICGKYAIGVWDNKTCQSASTINILSGTYRGWIANGDAYANGTWPGMTINIGSESGVTRIEPYTGFEESVLSIGNITIIGDNTTIIGGVYGGYDDVGTTANTSSLIINGGYIANAVAAMSGSVAITGGTVTGDVVAVAGSVTVTSGAIGGEVGAEDGATLTIAPPVSGTAPIFAHKPDVAYCNDCYPLANADVATSAAYPWTVGAAVAKIVTASGTDYYATFAEAVDAVQDGETITVIGYNAETMTAPTGWTFATDTSVEPSVTTLVRKAYVAQIVTNNGTTTNKYESLADAYSHSVSGDTIEMIADDRLSAELAIKRSVTITGAVDENGKPLYTIYGKPTDNYNVDVFIKNESSAIDVTIQNVNISEFGHQYGTQAGNGALYVSRSTHADTHVLVSNVTFSAYNNYAIIAPQGQLEVVDCTIDGDRDPSYGDFWTGGIWSGDMFDDLPSSSVSVLRTTIINLDSNKSGTTAYAIDARAGSTVTVTDCTITNVHDGIASVAAQESGDGATSVTVSGTTVEAGRNALAISGNPIYLGGSVIAELSVSSGTFIGTVALPAEYEDYGLIEISGGYFSAPVPADFCADGYVPTPQDPVTGLYTVRIGYAKDDEVVVVGDSDYPITQTEADYLNALLDKGGEGYSKDAITNALANMSVSDFQEAALLNIDITKTYAKPIFKITAIKRNRTNGTVSVTVTLTRENKVAQPIRGTLILETSSDCVNWDGCQDVQLYDEHFSESDTAVITMPIAKNARIFKAKVVERTASAPTSGD